MLYAYRVLMTGVHLLRTGEVEANLLRLNEHFGFGFLDELIARKVGDENTSVGDLDWPFHEARLCLMARKGYWRQNGESVRRAQ